MVNNKIILNAYLYLKEKNTISIIIPLVLSAIVHGTMINYFFIEDDFANFYQIANVGSWQSLITPWGGHVMIIRNLFFLVFFKLFGLFSPIYFIFVLVIHLANVALLYFVIYKFNKNRLQATFWSVVWGIAPIQQGSLGWCSAFGHVIIVTFILVILFDMGRVINDGLYPTSAIVMRWILLLIAASISWGLGISIAIVFSIVAWLMLYGVEKRNLIALAFLSLIIIVPIIYHSVMWLYQGGTGTHQQGSIFIGWGDPYFWLLEAKVLAGMLSYSLSGILLGPYIIAGKYFIPGYVVPISYFILMVVFIFGIITYYKSSTNTRYRIVAFCVLFVVICATFVLGRAWMMSKLGMPSSLIVQIPRYYYSSSMICAILLSVCCSAFINKINMRPRVAFILSVIFLIILFVPSRRAAKIVDIDHGKKNKLEINRVVSEIQKEINSMPENGVLYIKNENTKSIWMVAPKESFPGIAAIYITMFSDRELPGKKIFFVEEDATMVRELRKSGHSRISRLLVTKEEAGSNPITTISF